MQLDMHGKVAIITGPAKGMGEAVTRAFADAGCRLVLAGRDTAAIAPVSREIEGSLVVACDITDGAQCDALAQTTIETFGRIDILVNVAGGSGPIGKTGWETTSAEFDEIVTLNMTGCFNTMRSVLPEMIRNRYGKIVNVGGTFGMRGRAGRMAYSASKWGLRGITKSFALEAGPYGINVNTVAPGMVDGDRFRTKVVPEMAARLGIDHEAAAQHHADDYALRRITTGVDVANACVFLASDAARQITGVDLPVDGGWAML